MHDMRAVSDMLKPCDARMMRCYPVTMRINRVANDDEEKLATLANQRKIMPMRSLKVHVANLSLSVTKPAWVIYSAVDTLVPQSRGLLGVSIRDKTRG